MKKLLALAITIVGCANVVYADEEFIIKMQPSASQAMLLSTASGRDQVRIMQMQPLALATLSEINAVSEHYFIDDRPIANGAHVIKCSGNMSTIERDALIHKLEKLPGVKYVERNSIMQSFSSNSNYNTTYQWDMTESMNMAAAGCPSCNFTGDNFTGAWSELVNPAGNGIIVAVLDTGYTQHPAFGFIPGGSLTGSALVSGLANPNLGYGYDFITSCANAGTVESGAPAPGCASSTSGRRTPQPNALDLGDYTTTQDQSIIASTWHGTMVAGIVNGQGVSSAYESASLGGAYAAKVLPVRVLAAGGGTLDGIINGMYWAAGFVVSNESNVSINIAPAKIINMSLGESNVTTCGPAYQDAINDIKQNGPTHPIFVVAAGNEAGNVTTSRPANCNGVISVAAVGPTNILSSYSNYGNVTIAASGGDVKINSQIGGVYFPAYSSEQNYYPVSPINFIWNGQNENGGTSAAAPHVAAAIALLLSVAPSTSESKIIDILQDSATSLDNNGCNEAATGCITEGRLNVGVALAMLTESTSVLDVSGPIVFANTQQLAATAIVTNNTESNIIINNTTVTQAQGSFTAVTICNTPGYPPTVATANGGTCTVTVTVSSFGPVSGNVQLNNGTNVVAVIPVSGTTVMTPNTYGNGCSSTQNGEDIGLLLVLAVMSLIYYYRRWKQNA